MTGRGFAEKGSAGRCRQKGGRGHWTGKTCMAEIARLRALEDRHASLETRIADEGSRPRPNDEALTRLKLEKLRLKEEMERLRTRRVH